MREKNKYKNKNLLNNQNYIIGNFEKNIVFSKFFSDFFNVLSIKFSYYIFYLFKRLFIFTGCFVFSIFLYFFFIVVVLINIFKIFYFWDLEFIVKYLTSINFVSILFILFISFLIFNKLYKSGDLKIESFENIVKEFNANNYMLVLNRVLTFIINILFTILVLKFKKKYLLTKKSYKKNILSDFQEKSGENEFYLIENKWY